MTVVAFKRSGDQEQMSKTRAKSREAATMRWYLIRVAGPRDKVYHELTRAGFEKRAIISKRTYKHKRSHKQIERIEPLLGPYVFVHMPAVGANWLRLKSCDGVEAIMTTVGTSGERHPFVIPRRVVIDLYIRQRRGDFDQTGFTRRDRRERTRRIYGKGNIVRINDGPFESFNGKVDRVNKRGAVDVLVSLFGRDTTIHFHEIDVEAGMIELVDGTPRAA